VTGPRTRIAVATRSPAERATLVEWLDSGDFQAVPIPNIGASAREIDLAARWGGEEFCLILPGTDAVGAAKVAERIRTALAERTLAAPDGTPFGLTASFGVASHPPVGTAEELVAAADAALYQAKRKGKNQVSVAPAGLMRVLGN